MTLSLPYLLFSRDGGFHPSDGFVQTLNSGGHDLLDLRVLMWKVREDLLSLVQLHLNVLQALEFLVDGQRLFQNGFDRALDVAKPLFVEDVLLVELVQLEVNLLTELEALLELFTM